jgi:hypothetical protein
VQEGTTGYDFQADPRYLRRWSVDAPQLASYMTVPDASKPAELCDFVGELCRQFKFEKRNHYELLWVKGVPRRERFKVRHDDLPGDSIATPIRRLRTLAAKSCTRIMGRAFGALGCRRGTFCRRPRTVEMCVVIVGDGRRFSLGAKR